MDRCGQLADLLPDARHVVLAGMVAHQSCLESPGTVAQLIHSAVTLFPGSGRISANLCLILPMFDIEIFLSQLASCLRLKARVMPSARPGAESA